jgi:putative transcriptional regulator
MSKKAFDKIAAGLNEVLEITRGNAKPSKLYVPPEISVREVRKKLNLSQDDFAAEFGFTINQIRDWEQGSNPSAWWAPGIPHAHQKRPAGSIATSTQ